MTFLKEDLDKIVQAIKRLADSGQEISNPEQEISEPGDRTYLSDNLTLIAQAIRDLNENNEITVEKSIYLTDNLNEIAEAIEDIDIVKPEGTININTNGDYNVSSYIEANVQIPHQIYINGSNIYHPDNTYDIDNIEFQTCEGEFSLVSLAFSDSTRVIAQEDFYGCKHLTNLIIPNGVIYIGDSAFWGCIALKNLILPNTIITIDKTAFNGCHSLTSLKLPQNENFTTINDYTFNNCNSLTSLTIPNNVTDIGNSAFYGCESLITLVIPNSVINIEESAFENGYDLEKIDLTIFTINNNVPTLGRRAFKRCGFNKSGNFYFYFINQEVLNNFANATNWSDYAEYFKILQEEE